MKIKILLVSLFVLVIPFFAHASGFPYGFGSNSGGISGLGSTTGTVLVPTPSIASGSWTTIAAGSSFGVGIKDGRLYGFGNGSILGIGDNNENIFVPVSPTTTIGWTMVSARGSHTLSIKDGQLYSFGNNQFGVTGIGETSGIATAPTLATTSIGWTFVSAGSQHSLAIKDGQLYSFGRNLNGQLGFSTSSNSVVYPFLATTSTGWTSVSAGENHSLAIKDGQLYSFGLNSSGQTGQNTEVGNTVVPTLATTSTGWTKVSAGNFHSLAIRNGQLYSFGDNGSGRTGLGTSTGSTLVPTLATTSTGWTDVSAGTTHSLAIKDDQLYSFGYNSYGSTGLGTTVGNTIIPTLATTSVGWSSVAAGNFNSLALGPAQIPQLVSGGLSYSGVTESSAVLSGNILSDSGSQITERGFQWGQDDSYSSLLSETGSFSEGQYSLTLSDLQCGIQYFFRMFVKNGIGDGISSGSSFTTSACAQEVVPVVRTSGTSQARRESNLQSISPSTVSVSVSKVEIDRFVQRVVEILKSTPSISPTPSISSISNNIQIHDSGEHVKSLQSFLISKGFLAPGNDIGIFGQKTFSALKEFQSSVGIPATGYFGPLTRSAIGDMP